MFALPHAQSGPSWKLARRGRGCRTLLATFLAFCAGGSLDTSALAQHTPRTGLPKLTEKPERTRILPGHETDTALIKFTDGSGVKLRAGGLSGADPEAQAVSLLLEQLGVEVRRLFPQPDSTLDSWRSQAEARSGEPLHDLTLFYSLHLPAGLNLGRLCDQLNRFDVVRRAWPIGSVSDPVVAAPMATGEYSGQQGYRGPAPLGVDADFGNSYSGGLGTGITIADVETGWTDDHEDIAHKAQGSYIGLCCAPYPWDHGTAVLGALIGEHQELGVRGLVYDADILLSTHQGFAINVPAAITNAIAALTAGDFLVLEVQCQDAPLGPHPCEWDDAIFASVRLATASGIHVYSAAGNGGHDLDDPSYGGKFDRTARDSGAVIVGASQGAALTAASFSNYGTRLDLHAWGASVTTTGYGDLFNGGPLSTYTAQFSGTSSATPIVAGAAAQLAGIHTQVTGLTIGPKQLRELMVSTGTPTSSGPSIGPRPDVRSAVEALGFPVVNITGTLVPGGTYTAMSSGQPGDGCVMVFGTAIRDVNPVAVPPYGYFMLAGNLTRKQAGALDASGNLSYSEAIPADPNLSGTTLGYCLTWQRFLSGQPGIGAFGNVAAIEIQ
jgi:serine protease